MLPSKRSPSTTPDSAIVIGLSSFSTSPSFDSFDFIVNFVVGQGVSPGPSSSDETLASLIGTSFPKEKAQAYESISTALFKKNLRAGDILVTSAGPLRSSRVIHTVRPSITVSAIPAPQKLVALRTAYFCALKWAIANGATSIALPIVPSVTPAAPTCALQCALWAASQQSQLRNIVLLGYDEAALATLRSVVSFPLVFSSPDQLSQCRSRFPYQPPTALDRQVGFSDCVRNVDHRLRVSPSPTATSRSPSPDVRSFRSQSSSQFDNDSSGILTTITGDVESMNSLLRFDAIVNTIASDGQGFDRLNYNLSLASGQARFTTEFLDAANHAKSLNKSKRLIPGNLIVTSGGEIPTVSCILHTVHSIVDKQPASKPDQHRLRRTYEAAIKWACEHDLHTIAIPILRAKDIHASAGIAIQSALLYAAQRQLRNIHFFWFADDDFPNIQQYFSEPYAITSLAHAQDHLAPLNAAFPIGIHQVKELIGLSRTMQLRFPRSSSPSIASPISNRSNLSSYASSAVSSVPSSPASFDGEYDRPARSPAPPRPPPRPAAPAAPSATAITSRLRGCLIRCVKSNIVDLRADLVVNAANEHLHLGLGVAGSLRTAAGGTSLQDACDQELARLQYRIGPRPLPAGTCVHTRSFNMTNFPLGVLHAVAPRIRANSGVPTDEEAAALYVTYQNIIHHAVQRSCFSIVIPFISTGQFGCHLHVGIAIALIAVIDSQQSRMMNDITFVTNNEVALLTMNNRLFSRQGSLLLTNDSWRSPLDKARVLLAEHHALPLNPTAIYNVQTDLESLLSRPAPTVPPRAPTTPTTPRTRIADTFSNVLHIRSASPRVSSPPRAPTTPTPVPSSRVRFLPVHPTTGLISHSTPVVLHPPSPPRVFPPSPLDLRRQIDPTARSFISRTRYDDRHGPGTALRAYCKNKDANPVISPPEDLPPDAWFFPDTPLYLGNICKCRNCHAFTFLYICCSDGRVVLKRLPNQPAEIRAFFARREFQEAILSYNSALSVGCLQYHKVAMPVNSRPGPPFMKVQGRVTANVGGLYPPGNAIPAFAQLLIYDPDEAAQHRLDNPTIGHNLDEGIITELSRILPNINFLYKQFTTCHEELKKMESDGTAIPTVVLILRSPNDVEWQGLEHPGTISRPREELVSLLYKGQQSGNTGKQGIWMVRRQTGRLQVIPPWDPTADPATYVLIFVYGNPGFRPLYHPLLPPKYLRQNLPRPANFIDDSAEEGTNAFATNGVAIPIQEDADEIANDSEDDFDPLPIHRSGSAASIDLLLNSDYEGSTDGEEEEGEREQPPLNEAPHPDEERVVQEIAAADDLEGSSEDEQQSESADEDVEMFDDLAALPEDPDIPVHVPPADFNTPENIDGPNHRKWVSRAEWVRYQAAVRDKDFHAILSTGKLAQLYFIDQAQRCIRNTTDFDRKKRATVRGMTKQDLSFAIRSVKATNKNLQLGFNFQLGSRRVGSTAWLMKQFQDAMAIINQEGKPDLFITMSGDWKWPEIQENLVHGTDTNSNPFLVNEVFYKKSQELLNDIVNRELFGPVVGYSYSYEFQKRGMPHLHCLVSLHKDHKMDTPEKIDQHIKATIPILPEKPHKEAAPEVRAAYDVEFKRQKALYDQVTMRMIHTPCEGIPPNHEKGPPHCRQWTIEQQKRNYKRCTRKYPKEFNEYTSILPDGAVEYARPDNGIRVAKKNCIGDTVFADNRHVVPYSPYLLMKYRCHVNVECVSKGFDQALVQILEAASVDDGTPVGQASRNLKRVGHAVLPGNACFSRQQWEDYEAGVKDIMRKWGLPVDDQSEMVGYDEGIMVEVFRQMTANEAAWTLQGLPLAGHSHTVTSLSVHEETQQFIIMKKKNIPEVLRGDDIKEYDSNLMAWFALNAEEKKQLEQFPQMQPLATTLTFQEVPLHYRFVRRPNTTAYWKRYEREPTRHVIRVRPVSPRFLERYAIRLLAMNRTGVTSFEDLRTIEGTLHDTYMEAAQAMHLANSQSEFKATLEEAIKVDHPRKLRQLFVDILYFGNAKFPRELWDEFKTELFNPGDRSVRRNEAIALYHIEYLLKYHNKELSDYNLPSYDKSFLTPHDKQEAKEPTMHTYSSSLEEDIDKLNGDQKAVFDELMQAVNTNGRDRSAFFLSGSGGTGKTFLLNTFIRNLHAESIPVRVVSSTGIAATLLNGTTAHRAFYIPVNADETTESKIDMNSGAAKYLRTIKVIIYDEATMADRFTVGAIDRLLRSVVDSTEPHFGHKDKLFGGKIVIFAGDFKQLLPVATTDMRTTSFLISLKKFEHWDQVKVLTLYKNVRAEKDEHYSRMLENAGNGCDRGHKSASLMIPNRMIAASEEEAVKFVYPPERLTDPSKAGTTVVLCTLNEETTRVNDFILDKLPGNDKIYTAINTPRPGHGMQIPSEYFDHHMETGMPPHHLRLKVGAEVTLLRNLNVRQGLCNGTRMKILEMKDHLVHCELLTTRFKGTTALIGKISMTPAETDRRPAQYERYQLPLRLSYCMTINKAQGQTFDRVSILMTNNPFCHGMLYVALSRVRCIDDICVHTTRFLSHPRHLRYQCASLVNKVEDEALEPLTQEQLDNLKIPPPSEYFFDKTRDFARPSGPAPRTPRPPAAPVASPTATVPVASPTPTVPASSGPTRNLFRSAVAPSVPAPPAPVASRIPPVASGPTRNLLTASVPSIPPSLNLSHSPTPPISSGRQSPIPVSVSHTVPPRHSLIPPSPPLLTSSTRKRPSTGLPNPSPIRRPAIVPQTLSLNRPISDLSQQYLNSLPPNTAPPSIPGSITLHNPHTSCFLHAVVQCFRRLPHLVIAFFNLPTYPSPSPIQHTQHELAELLLTNTPHTNASSLRDTFAHFDQLRDFSQGQQCCDELLSMLMNYVFEDSMMDLFRFKIEFGFTTCPNGHMRTTDGELTLSYPVKLRNPSDISSTPLNNEDLTIDLDSRLKYVAPFPGSHCYNCCPRRSHSKCAMTETHTADRSAHLLDNKYLLFSISLYDNRRGEKMDWFLPTSPDLENISVLGKQWRVAAAIEHRGQNKPGDAGGHYVAWTKYQGTWFLHDDEKPSTPIGPNFNSRFFLDRVPNLSASTLRSLNNNSLTLMRDITHIFLESYADA